MVKSPTADALSLVAFLCERSVEARDIFDEFLDEGGVICTLEVDHTATNGTFDGLLTDEPGQEFLGCLAAMIAADQDSNSFGGGSAT